MAKTNIDKLIEAAYACYDDYFSSSEVDCIITDLLNNEFRIDGRDFTSYAEDLDLSECAAALEQFNAEIEIIGADDDEEEE